MRHELMARRTAERSPSRQREALPATFLVVVLYGLSLPVTKLISASPLVITAMRCWVAAATLGPFALRGRARFTKPMLRWSVLAGVFSVLNNWAAFVALQHTSIAVLSVLLALQPGAVLLLAGPLLGERATRWHVAWMAVGVMGALIVIFGGDARVSGDAVGFAAGMLSVLTFVGFYGVNRHVRFTSPVDAVPWNGLVSAISALAVVPVVMVAGSFRHFAQLDGTDWVYLAAVIMAVPVVGHTLMSWVHRFIPASQSSLYLLGMNVVAIVAAIPINDEAVAPLQVVGCIIVLGGLAAVVTRPSGVKVSTPVPCSYAATSE